MCCTTFLFAGSVTKAHDIISQSGSDMYPTPPHHALYSLWIILGYILFNILQLKLISTFNDTFTDINDKIIIRRLHVDDSGDGGTYIS